MTASEFLSSLLCSAQRAHALHLASTSFAEHEALGKFYEALPGAVDDLAEVWQGLEGKRLDPSEKDEDMEEALEVCADGAAFLECLQGCIEDNREVLGDRSAVQNLVDEVLALVGRARFLVENLA